MGDWPTDHQGTLAGPYVIGDRIAATEYYTAYGGRTAIGEKQVEVKFLSEDMVSRAILHGLGSTTLLQEYRIAMQIGPSHVSRHIYAGHCASGQPFLVREPRVDSAAAAANRRWGFRDATSLVIDVAEGVIALHDIGLIGPCLDPANLEVFPEGVAATRRCRLRDLSLLRWMNLPHGSQAPFTKATVTPEEVAGATYGVRSDVFNLGRLYYQLLGGVSPFGEAEDSLESLEAYFRSSDTMPYRKLRDIRSDLFEEIDMFLVRVLHRSPEVRPESVEQFLGGLTHLVSVFEKADFG